MSWARAVPFSGLQGDGQRHSSRFWILQRSCTWLLPDTSVLWRYMMWYFTRALTSFLWSAGNPTAVCFPYINRWISYVCSAIISLHAAPFLGRPLGRGRIPTSNLRSFLRSRSSRLFTTYLCCARWRRSFIALSLCNSILLLFLSLLSLFHLYSYWTAGRSAFNFLYFLEMTIPPDVGFPFSYIKGHFACCPLLMV